jgi:uncharacterized membrane protein
MSFHKKALISYILTNLILIVFGYFQLYATDTAGMTDPDFISHGSAKTFWPVISLFITGIVAIAAYALRGLWLLGAWVCRKVA